MPVAQAASDTAMLLVMIALDANGLIETMPCVHISRRSIVSIIWPLRMKRSNPGSARGEQHAGGRAGQEQREGRQGVSGSVCAEDPREAVGEEAQCARRARARAAPA